MNPKELRRRILEILYRYRQDDVVDITRLQKELVDSGMQIDDRTLHGEIKYLKDKGFVEVMGEFMGLEYLNFMGLEITSYGVDLVEDPEEFGKLFSLHLHQFGNVKNSNVSIGSPHSSQEISIKQDDISPEVHILLSELKEAIAEKDETKTLKLLKEISEGAQSVFWNIVAPMMVNLPK